MGGGMGGYDTTWENESMKLYRMYQLGQLIRRTISPGTWNLISTDQLGTGGMGGGMGQTAGGNVGTAAGTTGNEPAETTNDPTKGTIEFYQGKYMVVRHTIDVQKQIEKLLNDMRVALGEQVSIEARFLIVGENFLEDLGVDVDIKYNRTPGLVQNEIDFDQTSSDAVQPQTAGTKVPGNLGGTIASVIKGGSGNIMQDNLQVDFIIRATQAHRDSLILTAPKITVLSGETAALSVTTYNQIAMPPITGGQTNYIGGTSGSSTNTNLPQYQTLVTGPQMTITPIISQDKKHVLLNISTTVNDFLGMQQLTVQTTTVNASGTITPVTYTSSLPQTETTTVQTRVSVPDGGTLLFGGLKITAEEEVEVGVPILSKIPILGRAFDNRSKIKDNKILLILVKPTIILQKEKDAEAVSALELPSGI
jgi:general secretion pathway protein D